jgi:hypothetical protein
MSPPIYTTCVNPADYREPDVPEGDFLQSLGSAIAIGGFEVLKNACDYMLHGKLVCLGGDMCAIGRVGGFETVDDKSGMDKLDNDFSINLVLCPVDLGVFKRGDDQLIGNYNLAILGPQGWLITERPGMPIPRETSADQKPSLRYSPTHVGFDDFTFGTPVVPLAAGQQQIPIPVFHCEIEGNRAITVCTAFHQFWDPISDSICDFNPLGIPFGKLACFIISLAVAPVVAAIFATAWIAGSNDNRDFDGAGSLTVGQTVVITGRWTYDASHQGWNEFHPVKSVHAIDDPGICDWATFGDLQARWCPRTLEVPPPSDPGKRPQDMTPGQGAIYDAQLDPANRWILHPSVDGCQPQEPPPPGGGLH